MKDMKEKIEELREVIGKEVSCNWSPTLRAKLLKVNDNECILEIVSLMKDLGGMTFKMPIQHTWNAYFY
jgi:hypothetical protein